MVGPDCRPLGRIIRRVESSPESTVAAVIHHPKRLRTVHTLSTLDEVYTFQFNSLLFAAKIVRRRSDLPTCIAGMHRSGTSMVAGLLQVCGLFLGPEEELGFDSNNGEPHFENVRFVALNDQILSRLGGSWNNPPKLPAGWEHMPEIEPLTGQAKQLIKHLGVQGDWGWKDPRNSLTLPFWRRIVPDLRLVICLRNPLEVAHSLRKRGDSIGIPMFLLWLTYYRELLSALPPHQRVVTHYESYFHDPTTELERVADRLIIKNSASSISRACAQISDDLRHHRINADQSMGKMPDDVLAMYFKLCREAGPVCESAIISRLPREYAT